MADKSSKKLQEEIADKNQGNNTPNEIIFDPVTGELVVAKPTEVRSPDATVITQIATDGFAKKQKQ